MNLRLAITLGLLLFLCSCQQEKERIFPEPTEIYIFPKGADLEDTSLSCTENFKRNYGIKERFGDSLKSILSRHSGEVSLKSQKEIGNYFKEHLPFKPAKHPKGKLVREMVQKMKSFLPKPAFKHEVYIIQSASPNAFTIPGGDIFVTTGLLDKMPSDDAIAYVIGHELGHTTNGHTKDNAQFFTLVKDWEQNINDDQKTWRKLFKAVGAVSVLKAYTLAATTFNQTDELEADLAGMYLAYMAGYDPEKCLAGIAQLMEWEGPPPEGKIRRILADLGRSHPWAEDRMMCSYNYIQNAKKVVQCKTIFATGKRAKITTQSDRLNLRAAPTLRAPIVDKLNKGEEVEMICNCNEPDRIYDQKGRWIFINTDDGEAGWVWGGYLEVVNA